jgi:hypothetical protein
MTRPLLPLSADCWQEIFSILEEDRNQKNRIDACNNDVIPTSVKEINYPLLTFFGEIKGIFSQVYS